MNFYIYNIKVNSIASIGSLNIGNTILTRNQSTVITQTEGDSGAGQGEGEAGALEPIAAGGAVGAVEAAGHDGAESEESAGGFVHTQSYSYAPAAESEEDGVFAGGEPEWRRRV
ncbi:hypothetical protein D3C75_608850 [compost metagenome]